jgi:hypothetical protein
MFAPERQLPNANLVWYRIVVQGHLHDQWSDWFGGLSIRAERTDCCSPITVLTGALKDQATLRGILGKLWDQNLVVVSVQQVPPDQ